MSKFLRFLAWILGIVAVLIGLARLTVIRWWQIPLADPYLNASLAPTLRAGDWVILWRATAPTAGALVLCPEPKTDRLTIGRLIGEPGDHIRLINGTLIINGRPPETESGCSRFVTRDPGSGQDITQNCRQEVIAGGTHMRGDPNSDGPKPTDAEADVASGQVFLVSDNRLFPYDSREFGTVARDSCRESLVFRLLSKDGFFDVANRLTLIR